MNRLAFLFLLLTISYHVTAQIFQEETFVSIIPQPNNIEIVEGSFALNGSTTIVASDEEQKEAGKWFINELKNQYNIKCNLNGNSDDSNQIILLEDKNLEKEAYSLQIEKSKITIQASGEAGYFYAFQSIIQMLPVHVEKSELEDLKIPCAKISDQPRFVWRGLMLDISRHFFGLESLKKLVDQMAAQKMNRLHLHLSDNEGWRIEIKEYPGLHEIGGRGDKSNPNGPLMYLTEKEARELTVYAKANHITIIPEIDMPGHSGAIGRAYPEFSGDKNTLNVANPEAIKMVETVVHRLCDIFDTPYFHFGSDEVRGKSWEKRTDTRAKMEELGFTTQKELEAWFDNKIADYIHDSGFIPVAWDEAAELKVKNHTIVQWWRGLETEVVVEALHRGSKVIVSPVDYVYLDYPEHLDEAGGYWEGLHNGPNSLESIYNWNPIPEGVDNKNAKNILGVEAAMWTEFASNNKRLEYMLYPRLLAIAEKAWTEDRNLNLQDFQKRMEEQFNRYDKSGINYRIPSMGLLKRKELQPEAFEGPLPREKSNFLN